MGRAHVDGEQDWMPAAVLGQRGGVRRAGTDRGQRWGMTTDDRERLKSRERENQELRCASDILPTASAFFAQTELDRRLQ